MVSFFVYEFIGHRVLLKKGGQVVKEDKEGRRKEKRREKTRGKKRKKKKTFTQNKHGL
jgi:hypothetical protein